MVKSVLFTKQKEKSKEKSKEKEKEKENELLSKKRQEPDTPLQDIDMVKIKKKINEIMCSICNPDNIRNRNSDYLYQLMHKNYLLNEFSSNCLNYINKIITDVSKNHLKKFQGIFELNKLFISIIKELLMNEFELILLSLYLESIDISLYPDIFAFKESLIYLCYFIKKLALSSEKLSPINSFLIRKYQGFDEKFNKWFQLYSPVFNNKLYFSYMEINQRFKEYNSSYSIYCKNNYIDYNLIIDRILTMSIPYNEGKSDNLFISRKENTNTSDLKIETVSGNSINTNSNNNLNKNKVNEILFQNNNNYNKNNFNNINNLYNPNFITTYPNGIYINTNNNSNTDNLGYFYNGNNIIYNPINKDNNLNKNQFINKDLISINQNDSKNKTNFKTVKVNNVINKNLNNIKNSSEESQKLNSFNSKHLFITEEPKKKADNIILDESKNETKNISNEEIGKNHNDVEKLKKKEVSITPNNLLYSLQNENNNNTSQNNHINNINLVEKMYNQINNEKPNNININNVNNVSNINNNIIKNNEGINMNQNINNIIGFNASQQINDFNPYKYNTSLGPNEFNQPSQISFISTKNYFADINNLCHNSFHGIDQDENLKQLYQSNDNFFRSCFSLNSSKNFFPNNINNGNNNNIPEIGNMNNLNYIPINHVMAGNPTIINLNNGLNNINYGKNIVIQEKKGEDINNKNNEKN